MVKKYGMICLFLFLIYKGYCSENNIKELNNQIIAELLKQNDPSIISIENENEVYFNPAKIIPNESGLFLQTFNGECYRIPFIFSNDQGCFTLLSFENYTVYPRKKCRNCERMFTPTFFNKGKCPHCGAQN